jgi:hypothetical protein
MFTSSIFHATPGHFRLLSCTWALVMTALIDQMLYCTFLRRVALLFPHHPPRCSSPSPLGLMSHTHPTSVSSSNFQLIFDDALKAYEKRTKKDLLTHPLAAQLQRCNSPSSILEVLQQELNQSQRRNERWTRWLDPTVRVLHVFSETLGEGVTMVSSAREPVLDPCSHTYLTGISTGKSHLYGIWCPPISVYSF